MLDELIKKNKIDCTQYKLEENYLKDTYNTRNRRIIRRY